MKSSPRPTPSSRRRALSCAWALDAIAQWLETRPEYSAEVRGDRGPLEDPELPERRARAVVQAILERGISETRVTVSEDAAETGFEVTVVAVEP